MFMQIEWGKKFEAKTPVKREILLRQSEKNERRVIERFVPERAEI